MVRVDGGHGECIQIPEPCDKEMKVEGRWRRVKANMLLISLWSNKLHRSITHAHEAIRKEHFFYRVAFKTKISREALYS